METLSIETPGKIELNLSMNFHQKIGDSAEKLSIDCYLIYELTRATIEEEGIELN